MISSGSDSVGTAATLVDGTSNSSFRLVIHNNDNSDAIYLGGSTVGTATGYQLQKLESIDLLLSAGSELYAVSGKTGHSISWLKIT
jgi:hypothetical protein